MCLKKDSGVWGRTCKDDGITQFISVKAALEMMKLINEELVHQEGPL